MIHFVRRVSEWGVRPETSSLVTHHIRLTNVLLLFMFIASFGETALLFLAGAYEGALLNATAPFVFGGGLLLMKAGYTVLARLLVVVVSYLATYVLVASLGPDSYLQFILLFASAFSLVFFSTEEKTLLFFSMALPLVCFIGLELTDYKPVLGMSRAQFNAHQTLTMHISSIGIIWSLMTIHFFYFLRERQKSQEQLVASAKMVSMGRMAAGISHEINNPLQIIVSYADRIKLMAKKSNLDAEQVLNLSNQIQSVALRIGSINKGLLAMSRDAAGEPFENVPVQSIVKLALDLCRAHLEFHHVELIVKEAPQQWTVKGRETQLAEVLLNLLNNSFYAVSESPKKQIEITTFADLDWIEISVHDSGPGVNPKQLHRIFDPFFTTKPIGKGTGLGLSVSQGIMADHGGQLYYDPKSSGARFVIRMPRVPDIV